MMLVRESLSEGARPMPVSARIDRRRFLTVGGTSLVLAGGGSFRVSSARAGEGARLAVLHINDLHSRVEQVGASDASCSAEAAADGECFGGYARLATLIRERRAAREAEGLPVVTLDAGDQFQGSLFYTTYRGQAEVAFMNAIGFDAMALGNHEFDDGPDVLAEFVRAAEFPVISGNTQVGAREALAAELAEMVVLDRGGERVAVLSVLTPQTTILASPGPNVTFEDEVAYLRAAVERLKGEGIDRILVLSHVGFRRDREIAAEVDGISVIIGGHSHTLFSNSVEDTPDYATLVDGPSGRAVPIVQAYAYSRYLGDLVLEFGEDGAVIAATGDTLEVNGTIEPDPVIEARIREMAGPIEELKARPVAELAAAIDGSRESCRSAECEMGNAMTDAMLARVGDESVTIALQNGGGLRASLAEGTVTMGDVLTVLPFQNTLTTLRLSGAEIVAALEHGVNAIEDGAGRFPQVAGLRFRLDPAAEPGARVSEVEVREGEGWAPIDPEAEYGVATNNFMAGGGDGYAVLAEARDVYVSATDLAEVMAAYLAEHSPYAPVLEGRIRQ
jgi:5'-nucleotidase / UDP-sugar diphosphatase